MAPRDERFEGRQVDGVAAPDPVDVSESSGGTSQLVPKHDDKKPRPVRVQLLERRSRFCWGHQLLAPPACKRGARLRVGEDRRRHDVGRRHTLLHFFGSGGRIGFVDVQLHEVAGIEVDSHRRSSITIRDVGFPAIAPSISTRPACHRSTSLGRSPPAHAPSRPSARVQPGRGRQLPGRDR